MEANEGQIRVTTEPRITIRDVPLAKCTVEVVQKEMLALLKKVADQRMQIEKLLDRIEELGGSQ